MNGPDRVAPEGGPVRRLRLTHPEFDYWVDVRLREWDGKWLAVADLAGEPDVGTGTNPREALREAFLALGPRLAEELAAGADLEPSRRDG